MSEPEPAMRVTLRDVYVKVEEVQKAVAPLPIQVADHEVRIADHESRLRILEKHMWKWVGLSSVSGGGLAAIITWLTVGM